MQENAIVLEARDSPAAAAPGTTGTTGKMLIASMAVGGFIDKTSITATAAGGMQVSPSAAIAAPTVASDFMSNLRVILIGRVDDTHSNAVIGGMHSAFVRSESSRKGDSRCSPPLPPPVAAMPPPRDWIGILQNASFSTSR